MWALDLQWLHQDAAYASQSLTLCPFCPQKTQMTGGGLGCLGLRWCGMVTAGGSEFGFRLMSGFAEDDSGAVGYSDDLVTTVGKHLTRSGTVGYGGLWDYDYRN